MRVFSIFPKRKFHFSSTTNPFYDIVISGAGPAGILLACSLSQNSFFNLHNKKILLLDAFPLPKISEIEKDSLPDQRVVLLTPHSKKLLETNGIFQNMHKNRVSPYFFMQVWETFGSSFFNLGNGTNPLGYSVENKHVVAAGFEQLKKLENIEILIPGKIKHATYENNDRNRLLQIELEDSKSISTRLLIGADGARSKVKNIAGIESYGWSHNQMGIVCTLEVDKQMKTAFQRKEGVIGLLPLWDKYMSIVWSVNLSDFEFLTKLSDEAFLEELNNALQKPSEMNTFLSNEKFVKPPNILKICNKRMAFPLSNTQARNYISDRIALVSDAAHTIHPLGGQGLNMGIADVEILSKIICENAEHGIDFGSQNVLQSYETKSKIANYSMSFAMEFFKNSYNSSNKAVAFARNLSIFGFQNLPFIKERTQNLAEGGWWNKF